jgi:caffeoyl-CoA O-methyltransferase
MPLVISGIFFWSAFMRDYPFDFNQLNSFSRSLPYGVPLDSNVLPLWEKLHQLEQQLNFPALRDDVGFLIKFLFKWLRPKKIFEFGSGYGQSAFWYLLDNNSVEKIILTEKRTDLLDVFNALPWPLSWKEKLEYYQGDAFDRLQNESNLDFVLIDGVKGDYLRFLEMVTSKLNSQGLVLIDNSYWRGSFLDDEMLKSKQSARQIQQLHQYIKDSKNFESVFLPYEDGVTLLRKIT